MRSWYSVRGAATGLAVILALAGGTWPAFAAQPAGPAAASYTFAFKDADIQQVAQEILGNTLGVGYTIDPEVTGKISFRIDQRLTRAQLLEAFEAALSANGVVMVRTGDSMALTPRAKARQAATLHLNGPGASADAAGYSTLAIPLSYATPSEAAKALESMGRSDIVLYTDDKLGLMLLGGTPHELEAALQTLKVLDQSGLQASKIRWIELQTATATQVGPELLQILQASGASGITVVPLKRLNGILVFARTPQALDEVSRWVDKLDAVGKEEASGLWVYRPQNLSAESLANTLNEVLNGQAAQGSSPSATAPLASNPGGTAAAAPVQAPNPSPGPTSSGGFAGGSGENAVRIGVSKETNALIVTAPASRWLQIKRILDEIDLPPQQVMIEASVLEVTLSNDLEFGVDWSRILDSGKLTVSSIPSSSGAIAPTVPGFSVTYLSSNIKAAINTLKSVTDVQVMSAPKLITLNNHPAKISVGDQVPIVTRTAQSTENNNAPLVVSTEYRDTGIIMDVTPRVSGDNQIELDVNQEVSSVARTTSSGIDSPTIQQRKFQSTLLLRDSGTVALGGLISESRSKNHAGVPLVKDIPLLGNAFKDTSTVNKRTELIVLMTAKIIKDEASRKRVMGDLMADMKEIEHRGLVPH